MPSSYYIEVTSTTTTSDVVSTDFKVPQCIAHSSGLSYVIQHMEFNVISLDFCLLKSLYREILKCFPKQSLQSLEKLQDTLSDDQICAILNCSNSQSANKMILDCLIDKMKFREDIFDLCDQLDKLNDVTPDLKCLTNKLRKGYFNYV